jgi:hypothetical protein
MAATATCSARAHTQGGRCENEAIKTRAWVEKYKMDHVINENGFTLRTIIPLHLFFGHGTQDGTGSGGRGTCDGRCGANHVNAVPTRLGSVVVGLSPHFVPRRGDHVLCVPPLLMHVILSLLSPHTACMFARRGDPCTALKRTAPLDAALNARASPQRALLLIVLTDEHPQCGLVPA